MASVQLSEFPEVPWGVVGGLPYGIALIDAEGRYRYVNSALAAINGVAALEHVGRRISEVVPGVGGEPERLCARVFASGEAVLDQEIAGETPARAGVVREWRASYFPVREGDAGASLVGIVVVELTEVRRPARARDAFTTALLAAHTEHEVATALAGHCAAALGWERGWVSTLADDRRYVDHVASIGYPEGAVSAFARVAVSARLPGPDAMRTGQARWWRCAQHLAEDYPDLAASYVEAGNEAGAIVPLVGSRGPLGFIAVASPHVRNVSRSDRALLDSLASQAAQGLERVRTYEREHQIAGTLQRALLPEQLPAPPCLELAVRFRPAFEDALVGGDFYDVFEVMPGRWMLVIGDVTGKGPAAAAITSKVRYTLRAEARHDHSPARVLQHANQVLEGVEGRGELCTALCAVVDCGEAPTLTVASAGHPRALLMREGRASVIETAGIVLGAAPDPRTTDVTLALEHGDMVVLMTDGLLEAGAPHVLLTEDEIAKRVLARADQGVEAVAEGLLSEALAARPVPRDDIAILAARFRPRA